ncbi:hypothetical protein LPJ66_003122 [Kickxella alabastrina]|uniref:Uncharacterized protein n=1 Tax=Kickxella alabastrina TaxID=61397 RepID=A0ACC1ILI7_9FUNG|nr:hypothetical protein LPJ66_003122 [Kickxella alabastrina]
MASTQQRQQDTDKPATLSQILNRTQQLQTAAVEASDRLRDQCVQFMQTQSIRLEDTADTELEDIPGIDQCMNELMQCILYTELRKDIRQVTDALEGVQHRLMSSRQNTNNVTELSSPNNEEAVPVDEPLETPTMLSASDTFRTARGMPLYTESEHTQDVSDANVDEDFAEAQAVSETLKDLKQLEQRLYEACMEIDEWRRTPCVSALISSVGLRQADAFSDSQSPSVGSSASVRLPVDRIIGEALERRRTRSCSVGYLGIHQGWNDCGMGSSHPAPPLPPISRLLQVERETEALRPPTINRPVWSPPPIQSLAFNAPYSPGQLSSQPQFNSLRLIDTPISSTPSEDTASTRYRTIADDVRIIGWVTKGSGLDIHTEFKVVVHLTKGENLTVMRRYTDFENLRDVLCERYYTFRKRIPELPSKKAFGKFEDKFLKKRESGLQFFLAYVMLHPVIGCSLSIKQWLEGSE